MVNDDELLTREITEALGAAAEPLRDDARSQIRARVMSEVRADSRGGLFMLASHRVAAAATALAMLGGGVAYAADRSLPGDPLYGVKIATENAAVSILPPGRLENRLLIGIAGRRAGEAARLARMESDSESTDAALGALRRAIRQATPTEGALAEEDMHRIRERGADAPAQTREAIEEAVSAPVRQTAPRSDDERESGSDGRTEPNGHDTGLGASSDSSGDAMGSGPAHQGAGEEPTPDQSRKKIEGPRSRP